MKYTQLDAELNTHSKGGHWKFCRERTVSRGKVSEKKKHSAPTSNWNGFPDVNIVVKK